MCRPSFIFQPYPRRPLAQQMGGMGGVNGPFDIGLVVNSYLARLSLGTHRGP